MNFEIKAGTLKKVFRRVQDLTDECVLEFKPTGLYVGVVDSGIVCTLRINCPKEKFDTYNSFKTKTEKCSVNADKVIKILKRFDTYDLIGVEIKKNIVMFEQDGRKFVVSQIQDLEAPDVMEAIDELEFKSELTLDSEDYQTAIKDGLVFSGRTQGSYDGSLTFDLKEDSFVMRASDDVDKWEWSMEEYESKGTGKAKYPIHWLTKAIKKSNYGNINLKFGKDYPLMVKFEKDGIKMEYVIAPRVDAD